MYRQIIFWVAPNTAKIKKTAKSRKGRKSWIKGPREKTRFTVKRIILPLVGFFPIVEVSGQQGREIRTEAQPCHSHVRTPSFRFSRFVIFAFRGSLEKQYKRQQTLHFDIKREEKIINYHDVTFTLRYLLIFWPISNFAVFLFSRTRVWPRKPRKIEAREKKTRFTVHKDHSCEISLNMPMLIFIMGEVCASIEAIHLVFQMRRDIIILHHPAKINENRPITLGDNRCTQTYRPIHNDENSNSPKAKFLAEVIAIYNMFGQNIKH